MPALPLFTATVLKNPQIASQTRGLLLRIENPEFTFHAGQFINIIVPEKKVLRAYSIASSPHILPELELCVKIVEGGVGTTYIDGLKEGDTVSFHGPFGHFGRKDLTKNAVLIATGTGIAPMKSLVDERKDHGFPTPLLLLFGVREEVFASYRSYFEGVANAHKNFSFQLFVSRPEGKLKNATKGRVTEFIKDASSQFFTDTEVLICGSPPMVKEVKTILLEEKGVTKENIIVEAY